MTNKGMLGYSLSQRSRMMNYTLLWRVIWALNLFVIAEMWGFYQIKGKVLKRSLHKVPIIIINVGLRFEIKNFTQKLSLIVGFPHNLVPLKMSCTYAFKSRCWGRRSLVMAGSFRLFTKSNSWQLRGRKIPPPGKGKNRRTALAMTLRLYLGTNKL